MIAAYGVAAVWINRAEADRPFSLGFALRETGSSLVGLHLRGSEHLTGDFGAWFVLSVPVLGLLAAGWLLHAWLAPWRHRVRQQAREQELVRSLIAA